MSNKMNNSTIHSFDELPVTLNAPQIADALGISRSAAYALLHQSSFPTVRIGKRMIVTKAKFIHWLESMDSSSSQFF